LVKQQLAISAHLWLCKQNDLYTYTKITACKAKSRHNLKPPRPYFESS